MHKTDEGTYKCTASNQYGTSESSQVFISVVGESVMIYLITHICYCTLLNVKKSSKYCQLRVGLDTINPLAAGG